MLSGFGVRTMSTEAAGYWPLSYHGGAVWTHDSAIVAHGMARAGRNDEARLVVDGLLAAAAAFDYRMPELHSGDRRGTGTGARPRPVAYPAACRPQALGGHRGDHLPADRADPAQSTLTTVPPVRRTSSSNVSGKTVCGVPPAAQISGKAVSASSTSRRRAATGWPVRRDAADRLPRRIPRLIHRRPRDLPATEALGERAGVDPVRTAGHHQERLVVGPEHEAVRDRPDLDPQCRGGERRGRCGVRQDDDLTGDAGLAEGIMDDTAAGGQMRAHPPSPGSCEDLAVRHGGSQPSGAAAHSSHPVGVRCSAASVGLATLQSVLGERGVQHAVGP